MKMTFSTSDLLAPGQVGWVTLDEGHVEIRIRMVRDRTTGVPFAVLPTSVKGGSCVQVVRYKNKEHWTRLAKKATENFRKVVGESYFYGHRIISPIATEVSLEVEL